MDYQGNSNKARKKEKEPEVEEKVIEKLVLEAEVVTRKPPLSQKFRQVFLGGEIKSAAQYIGAEVLLPAFRNLLVDATTKGIERIVYGESMHTRGRSTNYGPRVTYNAPVRRGAMFDPRDRANLPDQPSRPRQRMDRTELILGSRSDAEMVIERLNDIIDRYQVATLADLYALVGLPSSHIDNKWGWESIRYAEVRQVRDGYLLDLPLAEPLN
jgi:hypothetical protein